MVTSLSCMDRLDKNDQLQAQVCGKTRSSCPNEDEEVCGPIESVLEVGQAVSAHVDENSFEYNGEAVCQVELRTYPEAFFAWSALAWGRRKEGGVHWLLPFEDQESLPNTGF